jgi:hypothetical protein
MELFLVALKVFVEGEGNRSIIDLNIKKFIKTVQRDEVQNKITSSSNIFRNTSNPVVPKVCREKKLNGICI